METENRKSEEPKKTKEDKSSSETPALPSADELLISLFKFSFVLWLIS
jgi:hypothetical protein